MIGPFLNAFGILFGALFGLARREPLTVRTQRSCQSLLGGLTAVCGVQLLWLNVEGGFVHGLKQLFIAALAVIVGNLLGKILGVQKISNRLGRFAATRLATSGNTSYGKTSDGFAAVSILFCAAPLGIIGAVTDGLGGYFFPLGLKAAMDGLAMTSFVKMFRWPVALVAMPVFLFLDGLAEAVRIFMLPHLAAPAMLQSVNATAGLIVCATTLVILEFRRVELANFLPALVLAPILTKFLL